MPDIAAIIQAGSGHPWLYLPAALLLGALHALEPGHSKSLMAAFIVAIRGTPRQAVLLGVCAAIGHTLIVWVLALIGLSLGDKLVLDRAEPWLLLVSGLLIVALALRLLWAIRVKRWDRTGDGHHRHHGDHSHNGHGHHRHHGGHDHNVRDPGEDAHAAAHAREIAARFDGRRNVTVAEIAWFGFTGGLLPCPAAIAVLLICLQLREVTLGIAMVAAFSIGLAVTLVLVGLVAAWSTRRATDHWPGFERWADRLPYLSGGLVLVLGLVVTVQGLAALGVFAA